MTTITIDRAVVEQALNVAENAGYPLALIKALRAALDADDLHDAARQALDDLRDLHANHNIMYAGTVARLEAALAQEQAEPRNQCGETCERAKLCAVCARELSHD